MNVDKKHWISNGAELVQSGDLVRFRDDDGVLREWHPADHLAGTRVDSFVGWHSGDVQFARVPTATTEQPRYFADALRLWQQASSAEGSQWITDPTERIQPGDLYRVREDSHSEYCDWRPADHYNGTEAGFFKAWHSQDMQFCRPAKPAAQAAPEPEWEPLPLQDDTILQPGRDEARFRAGCGEWSAWVPLSGPSVAVTRFIAERPSHFVYEFRRRTESQPAPKQPPAPTTDRGSKYHRTIRQTLPGDTHGLCLTVDVYDVLQAFGVTCPALQHAIKKLLCAGLRGGKSAEQDIEEAANSCRRAIELLEFDL